MKARCSHKIGGKQFIKKGKIRETSGAYPIHNSMAGSCTIGNGADSEALRTKYWCFSAIKRKE